MILVEASETSGNGDRQTLRRRIAMGWGYRRFGNAFWVFFAAALLFDFGFGGSKTVHQLLDAVVRRLLTSVSLCKGQTTSHKREDEQGVGTGTLRPTERFK